MKTVIYVLATLLLGASFGGFAMDKPEDLECANIKRAWALQISHLAEHLKREMPPQMPVDEVNLKNLWLASLGGVRDLDGVLHQSSTDAYELEIADMLSRGKERGCTWTSGL